MTTPLYNETPTTPTPDPYEIIYSPDSKMFDLLFHGIRFDDAPDYATADTLCQVHRALEDAKDATEEEEWHEDDTGHSDQHGKPEGACVPLERFHSWCEAAGEASVRWGLEPQGCRRCDGFHLVLERTPAGRFLVD